MTKEGIHLAISYCPITSKKSDNSYEQQAEPFTKTQYDKDT